MERPLTSYYLLLGGTTMLLAIGLMMVLSASSVYSFRVHGSSYYIFLKQLTWVLIGLPAAWLASRMNRRLLRLLAWPAVVVAVVLLVLTQTSLGFAVNGNRNWLALGPLTVQPSEIAKLSIMLWAADVYAKKEKLLGNPWHALIPVAPVVAMISGLVVFQRDLGTALVLFAILLGMLWVVGVPARLFGIALSLVGRGGVLPRGAAAPSGVRRLTSFIDPFKDFQGAGWQAGHGLLGMPAAASSARGSPPPSRSGATCPRRTPTSSSRCSARSSAWSARCSCSRCSGRWPSPPSGSRSTPRTRSCATSPPVSRSG